ncbi:hypothetical protein ACSILG_000197 [Yersinia enterocolitica]|uniref:hypothetical protein n=1 Tax=Yersinia enterocolitica TaxID=630 RepID=UPI003CFC468C|nr:hypothetical protein [Yersinia enterocolitica]EKN4047461.1 hypothetical protein [Yersinia enterocolitica]
MTNNQFYALYEQFSGLQYTPDNCQPVIDKLSRLCREKTLSSSHDECLTAANSCLHEIAQSATLFTVALSCWLTNDEDRWLAMALEQAASLNHLQATTPQIYALASIPKPRAILAACRLCAMHPAPAVSLGWALSLATSYPSSEKALSAARTLLQHHMDEYPATTGRLLASQSSPFMELELAKGALVTLEQQQNAQDGFPWLREFAMSPEMRLIYSSRKRSENREIQRNSEAKSIFSQFVTKQYFKYANKTAVEFSVGDEVKETTLEMTSFQIKVELPVSWLIDPVSAEFSRNKMWKGDLE